MNLEGRVLLEFGLEKELCVSNSWLKREKNRKVTFRMGENETEIKQKKKHRRLIRNVKAIAGEFQHALIIIIIIMVIFKCYFSGKHIALSLKNNNGVNIELGKTNRLKALCMMQINTWNKQTMCQ